MKWLALAIGFLLTAAVALQLPFERVRKGQNDFLSLYCGARLIGTGELHSVEAHRQIAQKEAAIWMPSVLYTRPPYYAVLLQPLGRLPYLTAYGLMQGLSLAALGVFLWMSRERAPTLWMWALCSIPLAILLANGQDVVLLMLMFAGALELDRRGRGLAAGVLLGCCTIKFHLFCLIPLALLAHRKWKTIAGACAFTAAGWAVAAMAEGVAWPVRYAEFLARPELHPIPLPLNFRAAAELLSGGLALELAMCAAAVGVLLWLSYQGLEFAPLMSLCVLVGLLVSRHVGIHDYALLLPAYAWSEGRLRQGLAILLSPLVYILVLLPGAWSLLGLVIVSLVLLAPLWDRLPALRGEDLSLHGA